MTIHTRHRKAVRGRQALARLSATHRRSIEDEIERLIAILDLVDPDPDLEETGDLEPSLGAYHGSIVDAELDPSDDEPSLSSFDRMTDQRHWCSGAFTAGHDLELDRADYEPEPEECRRTATRKGFRRRAKQIPDHSPAIQINLASGQSVSRVSI